MTDNSSRNVTSRQIRVKITGKLSAMTVKPVPPEGFRLLPGTFDRVQQEALVTMIRQILEDAPLFQPVMPRTGKAFSVRMSNCGPLG